MSIIIAAASGEVYRIPAPSKGLSEPTELGKGVMDYRPIFQAASEANIKHYFVEQEGYDMPQNQSLKMDADYMKKLNV